jgi:hypothetical protein
MIARIDGRSGRVLKIFAATVEVYIVGSGNAEVQKSQVEVWEGDKKTGRWVPLSVQE